MDSGYIGYVEQSEMKCDFNMETAMWEVEAVHIQKRKKVGEDWETKSVSSTGKDKILKRAMTMALLTIEVYMEKVRGTLFDDPELADNVPDQFEEDPNVLAEKIKELIDE